MPNPSVAFPAAFAPASVAAFANPDATAQPVSAATPLPVAPASDLANLEPGGSAVAGTAMPPGGAGLTGWLSAIWRACAEGAVASGSASAAATVVSASNAGCMGGAFQVTSAGTGCVVSYEQSNDNVNWVALPVTSAALANAAPVTTSNATGLYAFASSAAFVRARVSTYGSGTVSLALSQKHQSVPVSGVSLAGSGAAIGSVTGTVNAGAGYTDSTVALAAGATFAGSGRASAAAQYAFFNATAWADQAGTLLVDQSLDSGASWQAVASQPVAAGAAGQLSVRVTGNYAAATQYRVRFVNGLTAQVTFRLSSGFSAN